MAFIKTAYVEEVLEVKSSPRRLDYNYGDEAGTQLAKFANLREGRRNEDGYLYVRCRAISSRVNKNNDGWPSEELARTDIGYGFKTFIGRPIFVDHHNDDPKRTRGVIVDAQLHVEDPEKTAGLDPYYSTAPENHKPPTWVELLMEIDAETYPKLAEKIESGEMDAVSMGANIDRSICSVCANEATTPDEYCNHIKQKGMTFEITSDTGERVKKKAYEDCYGVNFFEISNVFDPADETADSWLDKTASIREKAEAAGINPDEVEFYLSRTTATKKAQLPAEQFIKPLNAPDQPKGDPNYIPQAEQVTAPQEVNTLRNEQLCPVCRASNMEAGSDGILSCPVCGHVQEPEPFDNPDLSIAQETDLRQDTTDVTTPEGERETPAYNPLDDVEFSPVPVAANFEEVTNEGISEMFTTKLRTSSKEEADKLLPVEQKTARVEAKFGANGVHRGLYDAVKEAGLKVKVSYPAVEGDENTVEIPGENGIFNLFFAQESAVKLKVPMSEVPIVVEADSQEDADKFLKLLAETPRPSTAKKVEAESEKSTVLPDEAKPSDEPDEEVVEDQLEPVESKTAVVLEDGIVELDGTKYKLSPIEDEAPAEAPAEEESEKGKAAEEEEEGKAESAVEEGLEKAKELAETVSEDDKEAKLLLAFKIADMAVEMGIVEQENKMAFVAELEEESVPQLQTRKATLESVKTAGLGKRQARNLPQLKKVPRLSHAVPSLNGSASFEAPDEALYL